MSGGRPNPEKKDITSRPQRADQARQKGAASVSSRNTGKHTRDESAGARANTTKKQGNSI